MKMLFAVACAALCWSSGAAAQDAPISTAAGAPAMPAAQAAPALRPQPSHAGPVHARPVYANPFEGNAVYGGPGYGGGLGFGGPGYGSPFFGSPVLAPGGPMGAVSDATDPNRPPQDPTSSGDGAYEAARMAAAEKGQTPCQQTDGKPHGEVWAGAGTRGYNDVGGVVTAPVGCHASVTVAFDRSQFR
jgi:hypothetical protein